MNLALLIEAGVCGIRTILPFGVINVSLYGIFQAQL